MAPIDNTGVGACPKAWAYQVTPQNLLDFAFSRAKLKNLPVRQAGKTEKLC